MVGILEKLLTKKIDGFRRDMYKIISVFVVCNVALFVVACVVAMFSIIHALLLILGTIVLIVCNILLLRYYKNNVKIFKYTFNPLNVNYLVFCERCQPNVTFEEGSHILPESSLTCKKCGLNLTIVREGDHRVYKDGDEGFSLMG